MEPPYTNRNHYVETNKNIWTYRIGVAYTSTTCSTSKRSTNAAQDLVMPVCGEPDEPCSALLEPCSAASEVVVTRQLLHLALDVVGLKFQFAPSIRHRRPDREAQHECMDQCMGWMLVGNIFCTLRCPVKSRKSCKSDPPLEPHLSHNTTQSALGWTIPSNHETLGLALLNVPLELTLVDH